MQTKKSSAAQRAWNVLRLALLWARKKGVFKIRRLMKDLRLFPKFLKTIAHSSNSRRRSATAIHYGERQLSFDNTPIIHVKMHRPSSMRFKMPRVPCINHPPVYFDYDFESNGDNDYVVNCDCIDDDDDDGARKSFLKSGNEIDREICEVMIIACDDEGIDIKAEQFIAKFYEQMKMQRQVSYLQYNEMINRGTS
ncbi:hypothetical protein LOK49_LG12G00860 [Camellia lanceoleosa]|uniref:Uncharacterized protein n=1 Tax=Camellia lanceoleosa TaxID=1840588 RepID=A0ACC0FQE7_9ERIC|nr:hypothetical protein LOK49_LG12G00860 [Camellia lanceoleosa]